MPIYMIAFIVLLPLMIGASAGVLSGLVMNRMKTSRQQFLVLIGSISIAPLVGMIVNYHFLSTPILNFMLMGMAFSVTFANMVKTEELSDLMKQFSPILSVSMIIVILNPGSPLDYHLILGAGLFTVAYIISRAIGKYFGAYFGATITYCPRTAQRHLGLTLLSRSSVSLVFTGIAVASLSGPAPEGTQIIQGTIAAVAVINELIIVIMAKKGSEWAGEMASHEE